MSDLAIDIQGLGKRYRIGRVQAGYQTFRESLVEMTRAPFRRAADLLRGRAESASDLSETFWALRDISLRIAPGEAVGIIGRNGAGKTTLLKLLSRITEPTEGSATLYGRVGSLLEVGTGFHPELTGRENIFLNGAILGMSRQYIRRRLDEIVAFSEVESFLDTPVKHYSSGMYVRLAFAVAAHLEPEILLIDEVLAVGDAAFQRKCLGKMKGVAQGGRTVLFVSHNMAMVSRLCTRAVLLDSGRIARVGDVEEVIGEYHATAAQGAVQDLQSYEDRTGTGRIRIRRIAVLDEAGGSVLTSGCGVRLELELASEIRTQSSNVTLGVGINTAYGGRLLSLVNKFDPHAQTQDQVIEDGTLAVCRLPNLPLRPGLYYLTFYIDIGGEVADRIRDGVCIEIHEADFFGSGRMPSASQGPFLLAQTWEYRPPDGRIEAG